MNIISELAIIFGICLVGSGIAGILPVAIPYSVISLLLLTILLYRKILKPAQIENAGGFLIKNMGILFVPAVAGTMEYVETLKQNILPFLVISLLTTPIVYAVTAWAVRFCLKAMGKEGQHA